MGKPFKPDWAPAWELHEGLHAPLRWFIAMPDEVRYPNGPSETSVSQTICDWAEVDYRRAMIRDANSISARFRRFLWRAFELLRSPFDRHRRHQR